MTKYVVLIDRVWTQDDSLLLLLRSLRPQSSRFAEATLTFRLKYVGHLTTNFNRKAGLKTDVECEISLKKICNFGAKFEFSSQNAPHAPNLITSIKPHFFLFHTYAHPYLYF